MNPILRQRVRDHLMRRESLKLYPYNDATGQILSPPGYEITIGVGRNLEGKGISMACAMFMLDEDIDDCLSALRSGRLLDIGQFDKLAEPRQLALLSMIFNMGERGLSLFHGMFRAIQAGDWGKAADEALDSLWAKQVGDDPPSPTRPGGQRAWEVTELLRRGKWLEL